MAVIESAERAARALRSTPLVFLAAFPFAVVKLVVEAGRLTSYLPVPGAALLSYVSYYGLAVITFLFTPALLAGLYGVAIGALMDESGLGTYFYGIKEGYLSLLGANIIYTVVQGVLTLTFVAFAVVTAFFAAGGLGATTVQDTDPGLAGVMGAVGVVSLLAFLLIGLAYIAVRFLIVYYFQFYRVAAVVGDAGPLSAFSESYDLVSENKRDTFYYLLLRGFVFVVLMLPGTLAFTGYLAIETTILEQFSTDDVGIAAIVALAVVVFATGILEFAFLSAYSVAFYRDLHRRRDS